VGSSSFKIDRSNSSVGFHLNLRKVCACHGLDLTDGAFSPMEAGLEHRGQLQVTGVPLPDPQLEQRLAAYQNVRQAHFGGFVHQDGKSDGVLIRTRFGESVQVHSVWQPMGMRSQLTFCHEPIFSCHPAPLTSEYNQIPEGFLYTADSGGNERYQIYFFDLATGEHTVLTDGKSSNRYPIWSDTGAIAFSSNKRDGTHFDVYFKENLSSEARMVWKSERPGYLVCKGLSEQWLLLKHYTSVSDSRLFLVHCELESDDDDEVDRLGGWASLAATATKKFRWELVAPTAGGTVSIGTAVPNYGGPNYGLFFTSDEGTTFKTLRYHTDEKRGGIEHLNPDVKWDVEDLAVAHDDRGGGMIVVVYNQDGVSTFYYSTFKPQYNAALCCSHFVKIDTPIGSCGGLELLALPNLSSCGRHEEGTAGYKLGYAMLAAAGPSDVYVLDIKQDQRYDWQVKGSIQWTQSEVGGLNSARFVSPSLFHFDSFDGLRISGFIYKPRKRIRDGGFPVIVHPHGGPESQHRPTFKPFYQYLCLEMGICVIDPNIRGSTGYGKEFVTLDNGEKRKDSVKDIGALLDWINSQEDLDSDRVGIWGGSYGGYMCLSSLINYAGRFKAGISMVGIVNFVTFLENTAEYRRDLRRCKYGDERDPAMRAKLMEFSPITRANEIAVPLFIAQGANDPRVPASEAEQIRTKAASNGSEVWYMLANDEGHGFKKKSNLNAYQQASVCFWRKFLIA